MAYTIVLREVGATLPARDAVDRRVVRQVREGTGRVIDSQQDVGGWPEYAGVAASPDEDRDGYTNLEEFLNDSDPGRVD